MRVTNEKIEKAFEEIVADLKIDFIPFNDVYRTLYGFNSQYPSEEEFRFTSVLFRRLLNDMNIICLEGSIMNPTQMTNDELLKHISEKYHSGNYEEINYGIWLDLKSNWA